MNERATQTQNTAFLDDKNAFCWMSMDFLLPISFTVLIDFHLDRAAVTAALILYMGCLILSVVFNFKEMYIYTISTSSSVRNDHSHCHELVVVGFI